MGAASPTPSWTLAGSGWPLPGQHTPVGAAFGNDDAATSYDKTLVPVGATQTAPGMAGTAGARLACLSIAL